MQYRIYGYEGCPFCLKAKGLLADKTIPFEFVEIPERTERTRFLDERGFEAPNRTFPRVYALEDGEEKLVGGYSDLEALFFFDEDVFAA
jgi:glutaredoxin